MIVAIPVDENKTEVCVTFGRAAYFMIADTASGVSRVIQNTAAQAESGAGPKAAQLVVDEQADALITVRCGENAAKVLQLGEIAIYKSEGSDAKQNILALSEGKLALLTHFHAGFHGKS